MKALLVAGASIATAQIYACTSLAADNCTGMMTVSNYSCAPNTGSCTRNVSNAPVCATNMMTCAGTACGVGTMLANLTSCSKCMDQCAGSSMTACTASAMNGACTWNPPACGYAPTPMMAQACSGTTSAACTGEAGCFWVSTTSNACGASMPSARCYQCNSTYSFSLGLRSALYNNVGKTCSWGAMAPYGAASLTVNAVAQSSDMGNCPAFAAASSMGDPVTITAAIIAGGILGYAPFFGPGGQPFSGTTLATCATQSSGVAELLPSVALLGLIAFVA